MPQQSLYHPSVPPPALHCTHPSTVCIGVYLSTHMCFYFGFDKCHFRISLSCPVDTERPANAASCHQPLPVSPPAASLLPYSTSSARLPLQNISTYPHALWPRTLGTLHLFDIWSLFAMPHVF